MPRRLALLAALVLTLGLLACGGKGAATGGQSKPDLDSDPLALLPPSAVLVARVDTSAVYANPAVGGELASLTDSLVPLGEDSGFRASRDVDRVIFATYATSNMDVAAILSGRFDVDRLAHATKTKKSTPIAVGTFAGFATYTAGRIAWAPLTPKTLVAGTPEGVHGVLDHIAKANLGRSEPPWVSTTLETPTAQVAVAADFASTPVASAMLSSVPLPWVGGIHRIRALGVLKPGGLDVSGTLTYADAAQAQQAASGIRRSVQMLDLFGPLLGGLRLQGLDVTLDAQDARCSFAVDAQGLRTLVAIAPRLLPLQPE